jgi:hypothetical protein
MRPAATLVAATLASVLGAIGALHVYWALGGRWGGAAAVPTSGGRGGAPLFSPSPAGTLAVAAALALAAYIVLVRGGVARPVGPPWTYRAGTWALGLVFAARVVGDFRYVGLFKRVRGTAFAVRDDWLYVPLCALIGAAVLWLATQQPSGAAATPRGAAASGAAE